MLYALQTLGGWLLAVPAPTEHWATILAAWAWPTAVLVIVYILKSPLSRAAHGLADRVANDDVEIPGFLKVTKSTSLSTLDPKLATEAGGTPEGTDAKLVESLLEYAGDSDANAGRLIDWISARCGPNLEPEAFLTEVRFAEERQKAYKELIEGQKQ